MQLTASQQKSLCDALEKAFPDRGSLEQMVSSMLEKNLNTISEGHNLSHTIFELVRWAQAQNRVSALILGARVANSGNAQLADVAAHILGPDETLVRAALGGNFVGLTDGILSEVARPQRWSSLVEQLRQLQLQPPRLEVQKAYDAVLRAYDSLSTVVDEAELFDATVVLLYDMPPGEIPPLLEFVAALAHYGPRVRPRLQDWLRQATALWNCALETLEARRVESEAASLLIALIGKPEQYLVRAWLWRAKGELKHLERTGDRCTTDEARKIISDLCLKVEASIPNRDKLVVEFFVPAALLAEPVHTWPILIPSPFDGDDPDLVEMHTLYRTVIRSTERSFQPSRSTEHDIVREAMRSRWKMRWQKLQTHCKMPVGKMGDTADGATDMLVVQARMPEDYETNVPEALTVISSVLCYAETGERPQDLDVVAKILKPLIKIGVPTGIWVASRKDCSSAVFQEIERLISQPLVNLPDNYSRLHTKVRPAVILFWDDPERVPEDADKYLRA